MKEEDLTLAPDVQDEYFKVEIEVLKNLAAEISEWRVREVPYGDRYREVYCNRTNELEYFGKMKPMHVFGIWGWSSWPVTGETGDWWSFPVLINGEGTGWVEAEMPKTWNGEFEEFMLDSRDKLVALTGRVKLAQGAAVWFTPCFQIESPAWPNLTVGSEGVRNSEEMHPLGMVVREKLSPDDPLTQIQLLLAWGNREGALIGWERFRSMKDVHEMEAGTDRKLEKFEDWEEFEKNLRSKSLGREL